MGVGGLVSSCSTHGYNTYATPRTVPPKKIAGAFSMEGTGFSGDVTGESEGGFSVFSPGMAGRVGVAEHWDLGVRAAILPLNVGGDAKWQALRTGFMDLALNPGVSTSAARLVWEDEGGYLREDTFYDVVADFPLVIGVNLIRQVSVVLTPGVLYGWQTPDHRPDFLTDRWRMVSGLAPRVGLGLELRASVGYALHPEVTLVISTEENEQRAIYTLGVALEFGALSDRSDIWSP